MVSLSRFLASTFQTQAEPRGGCFGTCTSVRGRRIAASPKTCETSRQDQRDSCVIHWIHSLHEESRPQRRDSAFVWQRAKREMG